MTNCDRCKQVTDVLHPVDTMWLCGLCYDNRRPYQPPTLTSYGTLASLTASGQLNGADLGGSTAFQ